MAGVPIAFSEGLNVSQIYLHHYVVCFGERYFCVKRLWGNDRFYVVPQRY